MKKILFIDDEPDLVKMLKFRLEASSYQMLTAYDGEEGLKKVAEDKPDLVLLDLRLPKIDGLTLCKKIKSSAETKDIPVILISASGTKDLPDMCRLAGADDFVLKPFDAGELLQKIAKLLS